MTTSLRMLRRGFQSKKLLLNRLDDALEAVIISNQFGDRVPYEVFAFFSGEIAEDSTLSRAPEILESLANHKELAFTKGFKTIKRQERRASIWLERISILAVLVTAIGTIVQAFIPERFKEGIVAILSQVIGTPSVWIIAIFIFLCIVLSYFFTRLSETSVLWKELEQISEKDGS